MSVVCLLKSSFGGLPCFKALCDVASQASLYIMARSSPQKMAAGCERVKMKGASDCRVSGHSFADPRSLSSLQGSVSYGKNKERDVVVVELLHTTLRP